MKVPADGASVSVPAEAACVYNTLVAAVPVLAELDTDALFRDNGGYVFLKLGLRVWSDGTYGIGNRSCDSLWLFSVQTSTTNARCQGLEKLRPARRVDGILHFGFQEASRMRPVRRVFADGDRQRVVEHNE